MADGELKVAEQPKIYLLPKLVFVCFLHLKLSNEIDWSWWWITAPLWATAITVISASTIKAYIETHTKKED